MRCEVHPTDGRTRDVVEVIPTSCSVIPFLRDRCLVGTLENWKGAVPRAKEIEGWCNSKWGIGAPIEVKDINGSKYLFILPSKVEARRIRNSSWKFEGVGLGLSFWEDRCGCFTDENKPESLWVRVLGLPVFLWSEELFRALGDRCGGYIMTAKETAHRDHLQWARICVRGMGASIPATLTVGMGSLAYICPVWVESGARVVCRSEPSRYCDGERWREAMGKGKEKTCERNGKRIGGTRGGNGEEQFQKKYIRPKRVDHRTTKYAERVRDSTGKVSASGMDVIQRERLTRFQNGKGGLRFRRDTGTYIKDGVNGRGWALNRLSGREDLNRGLGPNFRERDAGHKGNGPIGWVGHLNGVGGPSKGRLGLMRNGAKWVKAKGMEPWALDQAQKVGSNKGKTEGWAESSEELLLGSNRTEGFNTTKHTPVGREGEDFCKEANDSRSGLEGGSPWTMSGEEQAEENVDETIEAGGQSQEWALETYSETYSEVDTREGVELAMILLEDTQIEPLTVVGPGDGSIRQVDASDGPSDRGEDVISSAWTKKKLKGFGKFLGISYGGLEDEAVRLFARIEQQWQEREGGRGGRSREVSTSKGKRELKNLEWSVSEGRRKGRGRSWPRGVKEVIPTRSHLDIVSYED